MTLLEKRCYFENKKMVYLVNDELGRTKVGITKDLTSRISAIKCNSGFNIKYVACSFLLDYSTATKIERTILKHFESKKGIGEWLKVPYQEIYNYANTLTEMCLFSVSYVEKMGNFKFTEMLEKYQSELTQKEVLL